jgi:PAS domain S-box-containing protein
VRELKVDTPFIFVSGTMGEKAVIEALTRGATDYVLKQDLSRLPSAIKRALQEAHDRRERRRAEIQLNAQLHFFQQLLDSIPVPVYYKDRKGTYLGCNAAFEAFIGLPRKDIVGKTVHEVVPKERADRHHEADRALLCHPGVQTYEVSGIYKDGKHRDVIFNKATFVDANGCVAGTVGALVDITEHKRAERERLANLMHFETMDKINRAIQEARDLEQMMSSVLDTVIDVFDCNKTQLIYPCNPDADAWSVQMERTKPGYESLAPLGTKVPMTPEIAEMHRISREIKGPHLFGAGTDLPLTAAQGNVGDQSGMGMAIYPKNSDAWGFSMEQCSHPRIWKPEEMRLFEAIGRRLADSLTSWLSYRELRRNEEFLDKVVEHIPNMIFVKDAKTLRFVRVNRAGERLLGYSREELLGKNDYDFFPAKDADFFTAKDRQALDCGELVDIAEEIIHNRKNEERILHTQKIPIRDETGTPQYLLGISEDITVRKKVEESLRKLSQAIEQSPVSIVITDAAGTIEFVNTQFTQLTGYLQSEVLGRNPRILKSGETPPERYEELWKTIRSGGVWQGELRNRKKNGDLFWEHVTIAPLRNAEHVITHYIAVKEDITERKKLEAQLRQAQKMEAVGQLAGGVAHDFNNMLGVIIGHAELAMHRLSPGQPLYSSLKEICFAAGRSADLTRQLLAFARKQTIVPKVLDLNDTIEGMLKMLRRLIGEDIDLAWLPGARIWKLKMDPSQVDQILANLCVNARDAIKGVGKVTIETANAVFDEAYCSQHPGSAPGHYVQLAVSDNGCGMDAKTLARIFEPFFTTKPLGEGTGLGLATVYGIVKQNNGFINVYSEPQKGATFKIYLPRHEGKTDQMSADVAAARLPRGHETILLVEDQPELLAIGQLMLKNLGYRVLTALKSSEAIHIAKEEGARIDLLLTDLIMPEMNGRDLANHLITLCPAMKSMFMSGYTGNVIARHGLLDEGVHFIHKPFSQQTLAVKLREVLDGN